MLTSRSSRGFILLRSCQEPRHSHTSQNLSPVSPARTVAQSPQFTDDARKWKAVGEEERVMKWLGKKSQKEWERLTDAQREEA